VPPIKLFASASPNRVLPAITVMLLIDLTETLPTVSTVQR
jgi:hypothetical protein